MDFETLLESIIALSEKLLSKIKKVIVVKDSKNCAIIPYFDPIVLGFFISKLHEASDDLQ